MYISDLSIENFRLFHSKKVIKFNERVNIIIGPNNIGKTTILKALELLFNKTNHKLDIGDFCRNICIDDLKKEPPKITISATIIESLDSEEYSSDLVAVSKWFTRMDKPFEAKLTYEFFLPEKHKDDYVNEVNKIDSNNIEDYWNLLESKFLMKYVSKRYGGDPNLKNVITYEEISKFDFQFLSAIRDVEKDLSSGKRSLLKEIIQFF